MIQDADGLEQLGRQVEALVGSDQGLTWLAVIAMAHAMNLDEAEPLQRAVLEGRAPAAEDLQRLGFALHQRGVATKRVGLLLEGIAAGILDWVPVADEEH